MVVVSDTTTISNLFLIDRLYLLEELYKSIIIPEAVFDELLKLEETGWDLSPIIQSSWISIKKIKNTSLLTELLEVLDLGEAQAIVLAQELEANLLIIDEQMGRKCAKNLNINIIGLIGILIEAKLQGVIPNVKIILEELKTKAGFWISDNLYNMALRTVDEI
jgi:predicted nucleic acid-binding protein